MTDSSATTDPTKGTGSTAGDEFTQRACNSYSLMLDALEDARTRLAGAGMLGGQDDLVNAAIYVARAPYGIYSDYS